MRIDLQNLAAVVLVISPLIGCTSSATVTTSSSDSSLDRAASAWKEALDAGGADRIAAFFAPKRGPAPAQSDR